MRAAIGLAINLYRRSPFHPWLGGALARLLAGAVRLRRGGLFVHEANGLRLHVDLEQRIDSRIYFTGSWEPETVATIARLLPPGGVAVDVGANIGFLTMVMARQVGKAGRVIAFEPSAWTFARLSANLALNDMPQVTLVAAGLSDAAELCPPADIPVGYRLDGRIVTQRQAIRLATLDEYLAAHPVERLDFIKCDTDGFEPKVLAGAEQTLRRFLPALHIELYQGMPADRAETAEQLLRSLEGLGYRFHAEATLAPFGGVAAVLAAFAPGQHAANVVAIARDPGGA